MGVVRLWLLCLLDFGFDLGGYLICCGSWVVFVGFDLGGMICVMVVVRGCDCDLGLLFSLVLEVCVCVDLCLGFRGWVVSFKGVVDTFVVLWFIVRCRLLFRFAGCVTGCCLFRSWVLM